MMPGPCVVCGATNYSLSYGGPTICPRCDCGHYDPAALAMNNHRLRERAQAAESELHLAKQAVRGLAEALGELSNGSWQGEMRFAEDTDADFLLRVIGKMRATSLAALHQAHQSVTALAQPPEFTATHTHADGGEYRLVGPAEGRLDGHEPWSDGVVYQGADGKLWWTGGDRWHDRFSQITGPAAVTPSQGKGEAERNPASAGPVNREEGE
jgi:hypothetical protein